MKRKTKLGKGIVKLITIILAFMYASSLAYRKVAWMQDKSIFVQIAPLLIALVVCAFCEE